MSNEFSNWEVVGDFGEVSFSEMVWAAGNVVWEAKGGEKSGDSGCKLLQESYSWEK